MIRVRLLTMNDVFKYKSVSNALATIVREEGFRGLYKGGTSYFANTIGNYSLSLTVYELLIDAAMKRQSKHEYTQNETRHVIEASIISSIITVLLMNFMEVIVVRRQIGCQ